MGSTQNHTNIERKRERERERERERVTPQRKFRLGTVSNNYWGVKPVFWVPNLHKPIKDRDKNNY